MKKRIFFPVLLFLATLIFFIFQFGNEKGVSTKVAELRHKHRDFLQDKKPSKRNTALSRKEKIKKGLPPNENYEQLAYLTMNPALGYPEPYKIQELQKELLAKRAFKAPGEDGDNPWVERGPTNVGGRTRVLLFDPNDEAGQRVFAGAISGGLWVNENITSATSPWRRVDGLSANLNISCITVDPRDSNTWYVGTGEQYTAGDVMGTGVYKTTDGGNTWNKVLDVEDYATNQVGNSQIVVGGIHFINDIVAWDNGTSTELFIGVTTHIYSNAANPTNFMGFFDKGLYQSTDDGISWNRIIDGDSFNDFEVDANGNLWVATTNSPGAGEEDGGGKIFKREKGENTQFSQINNIPDVMRTEIEASATNPEKFYILAEADNNEAELFITRNAFSSIEKLNEPNDADNSIPPDDFARNQAFYNLMIQSDPEDDDIVYLGGIDLFRSVNGGNDWEQISKWANNNNLQDLPVSLVHADHHVMQFRPGNTNQAIFGHDGGVSYASNLSLASTSEVFITPERDYITTQFYSVAAAPTTFATGDYFLGGTQDNGTLLIENGDPISIGVLGGDGAHAFFDQVDTEYFIANLVYNNLIVAYDYEEEAWKFIADNEDNDGFFINPQALDSNLDKLYSNGPEGILYRYDNIANLPPSSRDEDIVAPRESLKNDLLDAAISALEVSPYTTSESKLLAGLVTGRLLRIENAHENPDAAVWTDITGNGFIGSISDIRYGISENEVFVTFYNYGVENIWYTENAMAENPTWVNKEGNLPDLPVLTILNNPLNPEEVIVGTELGIWVTNNFTDSSPNWEQAYNGMSDVKVTDLDLRTGDNTIFAASYGRGLFSGKFTGGEAPEIPEEVPLKEDEILIIPTVSKGDFSIVSGQNWNETRIDVYSTIGQRMATFNYDLTETIPTQLDLGFLRPGIYLVRLDNSNKSVTQKIIVQ
ncbi:T9SS type A sorting domain-containing protein [Salinimicrobium sp. GXAS 041]|uniref:T9SS type A sorting domain-containing protein n=1 Tax=Salinimicrobium sp. GXAS 041 TaxID=3400806 RepID=UPI003C724222